MAWYELGVDLPDWTTVIFTVHELEIGDPVYFFVRLEDGSENLVPSTPYIADSDTMVQRFTVMEPGHRYVCNVGVHGWLGAETIDTGPPPPMRPTNWSWSGMIYAGAPLENLTAAVWNQFTSRINEFREYKGDSKYSFTTAVKNSTDICECVPEAVAAIGGLTGHGTLPSAVTLDSSTWIQLAAAMNAVT